MARNLVHYNIHKYALKTGLPYLSSGGVVELGDLETTIAAAVRANGVEWMTMTIIVSRMPPDDT